MKKLLFILALPLLLASCASRSNKQTDPSLVSIQVIDRNGFSETISTSDRLVRYQNTDFSEPQPYQKVLRVFGKNSEGKTHSIVTSYHSNGHIWQYLEVSNGRAHGIYKEWYFNGIQKMELSIIEGIPDLSDSALKSWVFDNVGKIWDEEGHLVAEIPYEKGVLQGTAIYYYPNGKIQKKIPYEQDIVHGSLVRYYEDESIAESIPHVKGLRQGNASCFFPNGALAYKETFSKGLLMEGRYYNLQGDLISKIEKGSGKRPEWEGSRLVRRVNYEKGSAEGLVECFDEKEQLHVTFVQKDGKKHGEEWEYYPENGKQPKILLHWKEDILQGVVKTWFPDGVQESQKELYQNKKNGMTFAWYKNGDLMLCEEYEKDVLTSGTYYKKGDKKPVSRVIQGKGVATLYHPEGYFLRKVLYEKGLPSLDADP